MIISFRTMAEYTNILLLGETGVGKSTFLNSVLNYLNFNNFDEALSDRRALKYIIPTKFTIDGEFITVGNGGENEHLELGESSTQAPMSYEFTINGLNIRFIDTPGIGDSRGSEINNINLENIFDYIGQFDELHAICYFLKPDVSVINPNFKGCFNHIFARLHKSASRNIIFVFTSAASTRYNAGQTFGLLKIILRDISQTTPNTEVPCEHDRNIFYFDNEPFKYLVAPQSNGALSDAELKKSLDKSWEISSNALFNMLVYILSRCGNPEKGTVDVRKIKLVNDARKCTIQMAQPITDILVLIHDNLEIIEKHRSIIIETNITIKKLQENRYVPMVDVVITPLTEPTLFCTSSGCCEEYMVGDIKKIHYKEPCKKPIMKSKLQGLCKLFVDGLQEFIWLIRHLKGTCSTCNCTYLNHTFLNYKTRYVEDRIEDKQVSAQIVSEEEKLKIQQEQIKTLEKWKAEFEEEEKVFSKCMAICTLFLNMNSIIKCEDMYDYNLERLIACETERNFDRAEGYRKIKERYTYHKGELINQNISSEQVSHSIRELYTLKHTGKKFEEMQNCQQVAESINLKQRVVKIPQINASDNCKKYLAPFFANT